ncbi:hypothetical protein JB92DRAFT_228188 [Gautieria morchelliformis]|nr:hypothetical protein JB92DRAFT_228188 [Gautieria morchelliformis]
MCPWVAGLKGTKLTMLHPRTLHSWCRAILHSSLLRQDPDTMLHLRALRAHLTHTNSFYIAIFAVACSLSFRKPCLMAQPHGDDIYIPLSSVPALLLQPLIITLCLMGDGPMVFGKQCVKRGFLAAIW